MKQKMEQLLCNARDEAQAGLIIGVLENAGIPYAIKRPGPGTVYALSMLWGVEIYVATDAYIRAKDLLDGYFTQTRELTDEVEWI